MSDAPHSPSPSSADPVPSKTTLEQAKLNDISLHTVHSTVRTEGAEPQEAMRPIPVLIIFLFSALTFWGGIYLQRYSGGYRADVFDHNWTPSAAQVIEKPFDPLVEGAKIYSRNCQQCHQQDGRGVRGVYPTLDASEWVLGEPERIVKILLFGMSGTITVAGETVTGNMPAVGHLKDKQIAAVLTYIRQAWSNKGDAVPEELVTQIRSETKRTKPWKPEELLAEHPF
jgi:mono/diheme cytochrome c family protein